MSTENTRMDDSFDAVFEIDRITEFIKSNVADAHAKGVVVGISGGVDSAVTAFLCQKAVGQEKTLGLFLFEERGRSSVDYNDAVQVAAFLKIRTLDFSITPILNTFHKTLVDSRINPSRIISANLKARIRMTLLYSIANQTNLLVAGTGDRSESLIGYFTKYGDGGADIFPIAHLYKTEVQELAKVLDVPENIITKPSSPNLWEGQKATDEIPADYAVLDKILIDLYDLGMNPDQVSDSLHVSPQMIQDVISLNRKSSHKRQYPKSISR